jgi:hypothetical protein
VLLTTCVTDHFVSKRMMVSVPLGSSVYPCWILETPASEKSMDGYGINVNYFIKFYFLFFLILLSSFFFCEIQSSPMSGGGLYDARHRIIPDLRCTVCMPGTWVRSRNCLQSGLCLLRFSKNNK